MKPATGIGTAMHLESIKVRFIAGEKLGRRPKVCLDDRIVEVRSLLRTDKSLAEIAEELGCPRSALRTFIMRRRICNLAERANFITLQRSIAKLDEREPA